jgi:signal peptidase II
MPTSGKTRALGHVIVRYPLWFAAAIVLIDQTSKLFVKGFDLFGIHHAGMQLYESKEIFGDFLRFTYVENPGMAFGLNFGMPIILSTFSIAASVFLVYLIRRNRESDNIGLRIAFAMILGGAVGNLIDRVFYGLFYNYGPLFYGKVVDFVDVNIPDLKLFGNELHRFYVFNIADAAVSVGVVLLLFFYPSKKHTTESTAQENTDTNAAGTPDDAQSLPHQQLNAG